MEDITTSLGVYIIACVCMCVYYIACNTCVSRAKSSLIKNNVKIFKLYTFSVLMSYLSPLQVLSGRFNI